MINREPLIIETNKGELTIFDQNHSIYDVLQWLIEEVDYEEVLTCLSELGPDGQ